VIRPAILVDLVQSGAYRDHMRDGGIVAGIVADDPAALTVAYDQYAPALYGYCWSLVSDPSNVAGAVRDTFVVAAARLSGLRDPSRLRPWLYSVARNECRRRRRYDPAAAGVRPSLRTGEDTADFGMTLEEAEQRELVWSALGALAPGDREIIELSLRHEFYGADLADALGVPRNQVHTLTTRAQARFETALGARMMTRSRVRSCPGLAAVLDGAGEDLSPALRRQVRHHMAGCDQCGQRWHRELSPTALLSLLPVPVMPASLRSQVLGMLADDSPDTAEERAEVAERADPFARSGFAVPLDPLAVARGPSTFVPAAGVFVAVFALFGGGAMLAATSMHHAPPPVTSALAPAVPSVTAAPSASPPASAQARSGRRHTAHPSRGGDIVRRAATPSLGTTGKPGSTVRSQSPKPTHSPGRSPSPSRDPSPTHTPPPTRTSTPTPTPTPTPTLTPTPTPTPTSSPTPAPTSGTTG
jgi:RNA polymerase sigma factor (sigma-70 family)